MTIRHAIRADRTFIRDLGRATIVDSVSSLRRAEQRAVRENFDRLLDVVDRHDHIALIAQRADEPLGFFLMLASLPDEVTGEDQAFIAYTAVVEGARKMGVGAALLRAGEEEARKRRAPYLALMVTEENAAARALYEAAGYVTERRLLCKPL